MASKPSKPKLFPGYQSGDLTVIEYAGRMIPPGGAGEMLFHFYKTRCKCGREHLAPQNMLVNQRIFPKHCAVCAHERARRRNAEEYERKKEGEAYAAPQTDQTFALKTWQTPQGVIDGTYTHSGDPRSR